MNCIYNFPKHIFSSMSIIQTFTYLDKGSPSDQIVGSCSISDSAKCWETAICNWSWLFSLTTTVISCDSRHSV